VRTGNSATAPLIIVAASTAPENAAPTESETVSTTFSVGVVSVVRVHAGEAHNNHNHPCPEPTTSSLKMSCNSPRLRVLEAEKCLFAPRYDNFVRVCGSRVPQWPLISTRGHLLTSSE